MHPEPAFWGSSYVFFDRGEVTTGEFGFGFGAAAFGENGRVEFEVVAVFAAGFAGEGQDRGAGAAREDAEHRAGPGGEAEEGDADAGGGADVLVEDDGDVAAFAVGRQHAVGGAGFVDHLDAAALADAADGGVDVGIVERPADAVEGRQAQA